MTSFAIFLLPLSLLALYQSTTDARQVSAVSSNSDSNSQPLPLHKRSAEALSGLPARRIALANLLRRRRSLEAALRAPPRFSPFQDDYLIPGLSKREDEWIWMPAHGYIPMPKDESNSPGDDQDSGIGNLLRYG